MHNEHDSLTFRHKIIPDSEMPLKSINHGIILRRLQN